MSEVILKWALILLSPFYFFIFRGLYIGYEIQVGRYTSKKLDEFPLHFANELEYNNILNITDLFIRDIKGSDNTSLSLSGDDINCLIYKGTTPIKPFQLLEEIGLVFYYFENSRLFYRKMEYQGPGGVRSYLQEISFAWDERKDRRDLEDESQKIVIGKLPVYDGRPVKNLEESLKQGYQKGLPLCWIYRDRFIHSLFNSDLRFSEEEIELALKRITSVQIVNSQLIFSVKNNIINLTT